MDINWKENVESGRIQIEIGIIELRALERALGAARADYPDDKHIWPLHNDVRHFMKEMNIPTHSDMQIALLKLKSK